MNQDGDFDLDIKNYSINDIEYFFGLDANPNYSADDIEQREYEIRTQLFNGGDFNTKFKRTFVEFISAAKRRLINRKIMPNIAQPTTIPSNSHQLDAPNFQMKVENQSLSRDPELLAHSDAPYIYSNPSEFFQGALNPLNTRILNKSLTIDTKFRENIDTSTSSDFIVQLPTKLLRVVSLQLTSIEFPVCFYGISASYGNNFLNLTVEYYSPEGDSMFTNFIFIIPDGNYTGQGLIAKINEVISSNVSGEASIFSQVKFSLSDIDGHVTVQSSSNGSPRVVSFQLDFSRNIQGDVDKSYPLTARLGWNLGFTQELYNGGELYVSEALVDPSSIRYIFLSVEDYNNNVNNSFVTAFSKSLFDANILARITMNKEYFKVITNTDGNLVTEPRQYFGPVDITRLHIRLYDDHGRILDMNNMNYSFGLTFKQVYNL